MYISSLSREIFVFLIFSFWISNVFPSCKALRLKKIKIVLKWPRPLKKCRVFSTFFIIIFFIFFLIFYKTCYEFLYILVLIYTVYMDIFAPVLFSPLSPSLSQGEFDSKRFPMSQNITLKTQRCLSEFKTGRNCLEV